MYRILTDPVSRTTGLSHNSMGGDGILHPRSSGRHFGSDIELHTGMLTSLRRETTPDLS